MKHHPALVLVLLATALLITSLPCSAVVYVKADSPGPALDGSSWATAFHTVQAGLDAASSGGEVWVAAGTYIERITLKDGVRLYGGFSGQESALGERDFETHETILDGNREGAVVTAPEGATQMTRIDGFTIRNSSLDPFANRCGVYCADSSSPTIANNTISGNGLAIECWRGSSPSIANNLIHGNEVSGILCCDSCAPPITGNIISGNNGIGIFLEIASPAVITGSTIIGNLVGVYCQNSSAKISDNAIGQNQGGGVAFDGDCAPEITNNTMDGNGTGVLCAGSGTALIASNLIRRSYTGIYCSAGSPEIRNNLIKGSTGTGIFCGQSSPLIINNTIIFSQTGIGCSISSPTIVNNIVAFSAFIGLDAGNNDSTPTLGNNCVYGNRVHNYWGSWPNSTDVNSDPMLAAGEYRLRSGSPCIDAGTNDGAPDTDLVGKPRPVDGDGDGIAITDIGAYEYALRALDIDVLPGDSGNIIKLKENRMIAVAILGSAAFDVTTIDAGTVKLGPGNAVEVHRHAHLKDANGDGIADLVFHFRCMDAGLQVGDTTVGLTARLLDGGEAVGTDAVTVKAR